MDRAPLMHLLLLLLRYQRLPPFQSHLPTPILPVVGTTHDAVMIEKARQGVRAGRAAQEDATALRLLCCLPP